MSRTATKRRRGWPSAALLALAAALFALAAACGGNGNAPEGGVSASFDEGTATLSIDTLDVGLLKGNVVVEAAEGWRVAGLTVEAHDPKGSNWSVLEFPESVGSQRAEDFFEVVLQELPRYQQIKVTLKATFAGDDGTEVERELTDTWPP